MKIILGSASSFRKKLMQDAGYTFEAVAADLDEKSIRTTNHYDTPLILSYAKATAVAKIVGAGHIVIGCDQVVICDGELLEKPESEDEIRRWYAKYCQHPVEFVNGITVINTNTGASITSLDKTICNFDPIDEEFTKIQIEKGIIQNCCGAIGDETSAKYSKIISGSEESMIGLPTILLGDLLQIVSK